MEETQHMLAMIPRMDDQSLIRLLRDKYQEYEAVVMQCAWTELQQRRPLPRKPAQPAPDMVFRSPGGQRY